MTALARAAAHHLLLGPRRTTPALDAEIGCHHRRGWAEAVSWLVALRLRLRLRTRTTVCESEYGRYRMDSGAPGGDQRLPVRYFLLEDGVYIGFKRTCQVGVSHIRLGGRFLRDKTLALHEPAMLHPVKSEASGCQGP